MSVKKALVVDDSRAARVILGRMLEAHGLHVDTAESGEQALEYLRNSRPDVVFMDHLMPGMDGFEAVKAIRNDPRTASIPVMMYTSQEGESYVREARAIGAVGVLPKTLLPIDVARALYQLQLLPERRDTSATTVERYISPPPAPSASINRLPTDAAASNATSLGSAREQLIELQRSLELSLEHAARRIGNELRSALHVAPQLPEATPSSRASTPKGLIAALLIFALLPTLVAGALLWRAFATGRAQLDQANARLGIVVAEQQTQIEALRAELRRQAVGSDDELISTRTDFLSAAYGEPLLAATRLEQIRKLFDRLRAEGFKGKVHIVYFTGDFCLTREVAGYLPADAEVLQRRCDLIGNPYDDALTATQRQPSEYATLITGITQTTKGAIQVITVNGGRKPIVAYPAQSDTLTAGEWNSAAARNHRVEITTEPAIQQKQAQQ